MKPIRIDPLQVEVPPKEHDVSGVVTSKLSNDKVGVCPECHARMKTVVTGSPDERNYAYFCPLHAIAMPQEDK